MNALEEQLAAKDAEIEQLRAEVCLVKSMHKVAIDKLTEREALIAELPEAVQIVNGMTLVRPEKLNKVLAVIETLSRKK